MKHDSRRPLVALLILLAAAPLWAEETTTKTPTELFSATLQKVIELVEPMEGAPAKTFSTRLQLTKVEGLRKELNGQSIAVALQAPDHLNLTVSYKGTEIIVGRSQQELWVHVPSKNFGVRGKAGEPRFISAPEKKDATKLGPLQLPFPREKLALLPLLLKAEELPGENVEGEVCQVLELTPKPEAIEALKIPKGTIKLWVRKSDGLPGRISYSDGKKVSVEVVLRDIQRSEPWPPEKWELKPRPGDKIEITALGHLNRAAAVGYAALTQKIPTLGPATGECRLVAAHGKGRLELQDGTRVLFLEGTPEEMGAQHGALLKKEIKDVVQRILYGVGVGSSFAKGRWFFGEIEEAQRRINPHIEPRYLAEMDAIAMATGLEKEEVRLGNFFPELFHCSGFALMGDATVGGKLYHGRVLDYLRGMGLEQNAVVMVFKPDVGNAWVNVSYAGFVGSVTAMNEKHVTIGEMGGRGEGNWDGKPMAQLVREVMEKADTLEAAVEIMRRGPRTCEYYYVISDAKSKTAVGIAATPSIFEVLRPGDAHPRLPHPMKDVVLMSAGERYEELARRVKQSYGKFDAESARDLMTRPVCMNSNIHSVLFDPESLDFWVANADSNSPASHTRYTKYNLGELLKKKTLAANSPDRN